MKYWRMIFLLIVFLTNAYAVPEPDWSEREQHWISALDEQFNPPTLGARTTIYLTSGVSKIGILKSVTSSHITLTIDVGTVQYARDTLHPKTRMQIYKEDYISYGVKQIIAKEMRAYRVSKQNEEARLAKEQSRRSLESTLNRVVLVLGDWEWGEQHGYAIVEGEVTNISQSSIQNVQAVVRFYTSSDQFITSDTSLLEFNPILPGQTSPFKVYAQWNPEMRTARISFSQLFGQTISYMTEEKYNKTIKELKNH
jgi:hypothetical protein